MSGILTGLLLFTLTQAWESNGPYGGFVTAAALDPEGNVFVAANQGLFRKIGTSPWVNIDKNLSISVGVNQLEWLAEKLWVCTKTEGLWWTKEADPAWHRTDSIPYDADVVGIVEYDGMIYVATKSKGVWVSEDGGNTFTYHNLEGNEINAITQLTVVPEVEEYIALAVNNEAIHYAGYNLGVLEFDTTIALPVSGLTINCLEFAPIGLGLPQLYAGTNTGVRILKPDFNWAPDVELEGSLTIDLARYEDYIYAVTAYNYIHRQRLITGDQPWNFFGDGLEVPLAIGLAAGTDRFVAVTSDGVYDFNNNGWGKIGNLPALGFNGIAIDEADPRGLAVTALGSGVFRSHDAGSAWEKTAANDLYLAWSLSAGSGPSGTFSYVGLVIGLAVSHNWGSWTVYDFPDAYGNPASVYEVVCNSAKPEEVWFTTYSGSEDRYQVWYSADAVGNRQVIQDLEFNPVLDLAFTPSQRRLYVSTVLGTLWSEKPDEPGSLKQAGDANLPANTFLVQLEVADTRLYSLTNHGEVFTSDDGAASWSKIEGIGGVTSIATDPDREGLLLITKLEGPGESSANITSDGGETWDPVSDPLVGGGQLCGVRMINDSTGHAYVATRAGVFHEMFTLESEPPQEDTLELTITPRHRQFYPEIGDVAEFELGGETEGIISWSVEIYNSGGYFMFGQSGEGRPPAVVPWDGYTWDGSMYGQDTYTAIFYGESETGSGDTSTTVELVLGDPPRSTRMDATAGSRLLVQDAYNDGFLVYRSRDPEDFFGVVYSEDEKIYYGGFPVSKSRDAGTHLASATLTADGTYWIIWMDEDPELEFPFNLYALQYDAGEPQPVLATSAKISHAAVAVSESGYPVIAVVEASAGLNDGFIHYFDDVSWSRDNQFTEVNTQEIRDLELVPAADGVHILYLAADTLHEAVWTAPGAGLDRSHDPAIAGVAEFSAASFGGDAIHLAYTAAGGLHYRGYSAGVWDDTPTTIPGNTATYDDITCNVNAAGIFTVAWTWGAADLIYYIQRTSEGTWSNAELQTPWGDASYSQLPARTYSSDQPFIAWTDGSAPPYRVRVAQLGELPPEDTVPTLTLSFKRSLPKGDTLEVSVTADRPLNEMFVHIEGGELGQIGPNYIWPEEPTEPYDSLAAYFYDTGWWPLGDYLVVAEGTFKDTVITVTDSLKVVPALDSTVLVSPEKVFFVPSPAVQQNTARIYYDLNYDARITLEIFTMRGKRILEHRVNDGDMVEAGYHNFIEIDISGLGSDVYVFRFVADATGNEDFQAMREGIEKDKPPILVPVVKPFVVVR